MLMFAKKSTTPTHSQLFNLSTARGVMRFDWWGAESRSLHLLEHSLAREKLAMSQILKCWSICESATRESSVRASATTTKEYSREERRARMPHTKKAKNVRAESARERHSMCILSAQNRENRGCLVWVYRRAGAGASVNRFELCLVVCVVNVHACFGWTVCWRVSIEADIHQWRN